MYRKTLDKEIGYSPKMSYLKIQIENPNVLTIVDSYSYDIQSFIGEVGGTLGLFLGLSAMSFVDFVGFIYRKAFPN